MKFVRVHEAVKDVLPRGELKSAAPETEDKLSPAWINAHPEVPFSELGIDNFEKVEAFMQKHGSQLTSLNLKHLPTNDSEFEKIIHWCPHLTQLTLNTLGLTAQSFEHVKELPLTSLDLVFCFYLTDEAIKLFKGLSLKHLGIDGGMQLTEEAMIDTLKGMPLQSLSMPFCWQMTDKVLESLKGNALTHVDLSGWQITDKGLESLKGMPLTHANFKNCKEITDNGVACLKGMPLESVDLSLCQFLTDKALEHLKGMELRKVNFSECHLLTDQGLKHLAGMPISQLFIADCSGISDEAFQYIVKMPLTMLDISGM